MVGISGPLPMQTDISTPGLTGSPNLTPQDKVCLSPLNLVFLALPSRALRLEGVASDGPGCEATTPVLETLTSYGPHPTLTMTVTYRWRGPDTPQGGRWRQKGRGLEQSG
jgi:hypothetical protein